MLYVPRPLVVAAALGSVCFALGVSTAQAVEDTRGKRGWFVSGGGGALLGSAVDADGYSTANYFGGAGQLRFGEEVIDRLTLGLEFGGAGGGADDFDAGLGGFFLQASFRPGLGTEGLVVLFGTGVGGGSLTAKDDTSGAPDGGAGGAIFQLGLSYELDFFGSPDEGLAFAPFLRWAIVPSTPDNAVSLSALTVGLEVPWYGGR